MADLRILVTGGRDYNDRDSVTRALKSFEHLVFGFRPSQIVLIHGGATGADTLAAEEADHLGWKVEPHPVKKVHYDRWGKTAPLKRNQAMVDLGASYCVAFPGGTGTAHCRRLALAAGIPVIDVKEANRG